VLTDEYGYCRYMTDDGGEGTMGHFKSNLRDIEFNLFELLRRQDVLGQAPYAEVDEDTVRGILDEVNRLATGPVAESYAEADRHPPVFDPETHSVTLPEAFRRSYQAFMDAEWFRLELPAELGMPADQVSRRLDFLRAHKLVFEENGRVLSLVVVDDLR